MKQRQRLVTEALDLSGFRQMPGWPKYWINECGELISIIATKIKPRKTKFGYLDFSLYRNDLTSKRMSVHRAVMLAFIGPCPEGKEVAHLDGSRTNNALDNLEYVTRKENHSHKTAHGTAQHGERHGNAKLKLREVLQIKKEYWFDGKNKGNAKELAKRFGVSKATISNIVTGRKWKAYIEEKN